MRGTAFAHLSNRFRSRYPSEVVLGSGPGLRLLFAYALVIFWLSRERATAKRGKMDGTEKARERRKKRRRRTNIRNKLTSEALACDVSLYRSLDYGPCVTNIRKRKDHNAFHGLGITLSGRQQGHSSARRFGDSRRQATKMAWV